MKNFLFALCASLICMSFVGNDGPAGPHKKDIVSADPSTVKVNWAGQRQTKGKWVWERECYYTQADAQNYHNARITALKQSTLVDEEASSVKFEIDGCAECYAYCSNIKKWQP